MKYLCSIYQDRPLSCVNYPWNFSNSIFQNCIFYDAENKRLREKEEQLKLNTEKEISDYCVSCGACCFFGPAPCDKLNIVDEPEQSQAITEKEEFCKTTTR